MTSVNQDTDNSGITAPTICQTTTIRRLRLVPPLAIGGIPIGPLFGGTMPDDIAETGNVVDTVDFEELLKILSFNDSEFVSVCHKIGEEKFKTQVCRPSEAPRIVANLPNNANVFFGYNPIKGPPRKNNGKGKAADVTRLSALITDLDVCEGKCASFDVAHATIADLSEILRAGPSAVTYSGNGLHGYWPITNEHIPSDMLDAALRSSRGDHPVADPDPAGVLDRWGRLVRSVAKRHGAKVDSVFNRDRILRVPGTFNNKAATNGHAGIHVICHRGQRSALALSDVDKQLSDYGIRQIDDFPDPDAKPVSPPDNWEFAETTCKYVAKTITEWGNPETVEQGKGRHPWLLSQAVRINCAKMLGCVSETDYGHAKNILVQTFMHLLATREPIRSAGFYEVEDAFAYGVAEAATKTKTAARKELGYHKHDKSKDRSQASRLVDIALQSYELGISTDGRPFGYTSSAPHVALDLRGSRLGLRQALASDYFRKFDAAPTTAAIAAAMQTLEGMAREQVPSALGLRVAGDNNAVYIDMADPDNWVIEISGGTWKIANSSPHMFRRTELTKPMPEPVAGGDVSKLWEYLNIADEDRALLMAVATDALINPDTAKPVTGFTGEHGTAKSASATRFVSLMDPSEVPLHSPPKDLEHWTSAAGGSWVVGLDNLSNVPDWLSDAFCRASTGSGSVKRQLYTDDNLSVVRFRRCVVFNGIDFGGLRGDLADRLISFDLQPITDEVRKTDADLESAWCKDWPVILGGLLDLAAKIHQMLPTQHDQPLPRMADFARVLICVDAITGSEGMARYRNRLNRGLAHSAVSDLFIGYLIDKKYDTTDTGKTAAEILTHISRTRAAESVSFQVSHDWPQHPKTVTTLLKRNAPGLRSMGWHVSNDDGRNERGIILWFIRPPGDAGDGGTGEFSPVITLHTKSCERGKGRETERGGKM